MLVVRRKGGRPRREMESLDKELTSFGGLRSYVCALYMAGSSCETIADKLFAVGKVRVSPRTVSNWLNLWASQDAAQAKEQVVQTA